MGLRLFMLSAALVAALAPVSRGSAQFVDRISEIAGDGGFESDGQLRYFNRQDCGLSGSSGTGGTGGDGGGGMAGTGGTGGTAGMGGEGGMGGGMSPALFGPKSPETTDFTIRLDSTSGSVSEVYLWVGAEDSNCNELTNRNETQTACAQVPGNPRIVGTNLLVSGLFLQDLLDARAGNAEIVSCETSGLQGTPYEIYAFRNQAFSGTDVPPESFGVTEFRVDVVAPAAPRVNTNPQAQSNFLITWGEPDPPDLIQNWRFYFSRDSDPSTAEEIGITAGLQARSQTISASQLGLTDENPDGFVFMTAIDQAFVSDALTQANEGELSDPVPVSFVAVEGVCGADDVCGGCSAAPMAFGLETTLSGAVWMLLLILLGTRFRRLGT